MIATRRHLLLVGFGGTLAAASVLLSSAHAAAEPFDYDTYVEIVTGTSVVVEQTTPRDWRDLVLPEELR